MSIFATSSSDDWVGLAFAVAVAVYLVIVLVFPEKF